MHFDFSLAIALGAVTGIAGRLEAILTLISGRLANQNIDQGGVDWILTFFRSVTFRAYRRRHMNLAFRQPGAGLMNTIAK